MICFVCRERATIWCHNDEAALCAVCDHAVHSAGPLAWTHRRTALVAKVGSSSYGQSAHVDVQKTRKLPEVGANMGYRCPQVREQAINKAVTHVEFSTHAFCCDTLLK